MDQPLLPVTSFPVQNTMFWFPCVNISGVRRKFKMAEGSKSFLQFVPLSSAVDAVFWQKLKENKLNVYHLDDQPKPMKGYYVNSKLNSLIFTVGI